jgi:hypothetical protein
MSIDKTMTAGIQGWLCKIKQWRHVSPKSLSAHLFLWRYRFSMAPSLYQAIDFIEKGWRHCLPTVAVVREEKSTALKRDAHER